MKFRGYECQPENWSAAPDYEDEEPLDEKRETETTRERGEDMKVKYHRNGVGGAPYYVVAVHGRDGSPDVMLAIAPEHAVHDEEGRLLPPDAHVPEILVIDPRGVMGFVEGGEMEAWRGADYWSREVLEALAREEEVES